MLLLLKRIFRRLQRTRAEVPCLYVSTTAKVAVVVSRAQLVFAEQDKHDTRVFTPRLGAVLED